MQIVDPTAELDVAVRTLAPRSGELRGTVGLLDINKPRGNVFIDHLERLIHDRIPSLEVRRYSKPFFTRVAPPDLRKQILEECQFVIEAMAD